MKTKIKTIEVLFEKTETYSKSSVEVFTNNALNKVAELISNIAASILKTILLSLFLLFTNLGIAFWIGEYIGKIYYGFFIVGLFYLISILLVKYFQNKWVITPIKKYILRKRKSV